MSAKLKINLVQAIICKKDYKANTVDPDEMAHYEPSHLGVQCLQIINCCDWLFKQKKY